MLSGVKAKPLGLQKVLILIISLTMSLFVLGCGKTDEASSVASTPGDGGDPPPPPPQPPPPPGDDDPRMDPVAFFQYCNFLDGLFIPVGATEFICEYEPYGTVPLDFFGNPLGAILLPGVPHSGLAAALPVEDGMEMRLTGSARLGESEFFSCDWKVPSTTLNFSDGTSTYTVPFGETIEIQNTGALRLGWGLEANNYSCGEINADVTFIRCIDAANHTVLCPL